jgi:endonuclease/exonuclease/phosphatase family metal-dependent hydrolase
MRLRVAAYNVHGLRAGPDRVAAALEQLRPDVLLLQETGRRGRLARLAAALGMQAAADPRSPLRRRVPNAVLVRPPWRVAEHRLHRFARSALLFPRGALLARVLRPGRELWAVSVHLGLRPAERRRHAAELLGVCAGLAGPVVIGGDLNELPDGRNAAALATRYRDAHAAAGAGGGETFPAARPTARIDYVFVSPSVAVVACRVADGPAVAAASDHRPVVADLELPDG